MTVTVLFFGHLAEIAGASSRAVEVDAMDGGATLGALHKKLSELFPALSGKQYAMAVDKKIIPAADMETAPLAGGCTVALLPPFSGG